jgi:hypothetical protein
MKKREFAWETLEKIENLYNQYSRSLRLAYKWSPQVIDKIEIGRLIQIIEETKEDFKREDKCLD